MDSAEGHESFLPGRGDWALLAGLALLSCWNLGRVDLSVTDEARSAVIVRDMVEGGHWLLPRTPDGYLCEKPLLYYGTAAILGSVFGVNEWTLRLVSVAMAIATLLMTWLLARLYGPARAARIAVVALAANIVFLGSSRDAMVDMTLAFFLTAGLTAHFASRLERVPAMTGATLAGIAFGLALLTKGPLGLALPIAVVGGDALLEHRGRFWRALTWWKPGLVTVGIALGIASLWYVPAYLRGGNEFLETSVLSENFYMPLGLAKGLGVSHRKPIFYYLGLQIVSVLPLLPLLPALGGWARDPASGVARRHLLGWLGFGFLLFQLASNKRMYYLVPLQPAVAVMIALAADRSLGRDADRILRYGAVVTGVLVALGGLCFWFVSFQAPLFHSIREGTVSAALAHHSGWIRFFGALLFLTGVALARVRVSESAVQWSCGLAVVVILVYFGLGSRLLADFNRTRPFVAAASAKLPVGATPVILPPIRGYSIDFYWPERIVRDKEAAKTAEYLLVARPQLSSVGPHTVLGTWPYGPDGRDDVLLVRVAR